MLYKFIADPDALAFFLQGMVRFTPIHELNDPSELVPTLNSTAVRDSLRQLRVTGYHEEDLVQLRQQGELLSRLAPGFQAVRVPRTPEAATKLIRSPFYDGTANLEGLLADTAREMSSKVGMLCLTRRYDSLPMWAHYAANAFGVVVGFGNLESVFTGDGTGVLCQPTLVEYKQEQVGVTFDPRSHRSLFFSKFADWSYEQEVRVVLPLDECLEKSVKGRPLYFYNIPPATVTQIVLGWNIPPAQVTAVRGLVAASASPVDILQASFTRGRVVLR